MISSNISRHSDVQQRGIINIGQPLFDVPQVWCGNAADLQTYEVESASLTTWSEPHANWCFIRSLLPQNPHGTRGEQTRNCLDRLERILGHANMIFANVVRTWFFNYRILDWYDEFNSVRTAFFSERNLAFLPASTGVGMPNGAGSALSCGAIAVVPSDKFADLREVLSPMQGPAPAYRSSFSRAMAFDTPEQKRMWISGTASIAPSGETVHIGDVDKQIALTLDVVEAMLHAEKYTWANISRAVGYFRNVSDVQRFDFHARQRELPPLPITFVHADICRDNLLFELEADAIR